jgi:hypothetical protein
MLLASLVDTGTILIVVLLISIISLSAFWPKEMTINDFINHQYVGDNSSSE